MPKNKKPRKKSMLSQVQSALITQKKTIDNAIQKSVALHQQGNISEALEITKQALVRAPNNITLLNNAGAFSAILRDFEQSKIHLSKSLKIKPQDLNALNNLSNILAELKQYDQASDIYRKILKLDPNNANTHSNFANVLQEQENYTEAEKHHIIAIQLDPNNASAYNNLGVLYKEQKQFNGAKEYYQKALSLNPNNISSKWNLSLLQLILTEFSEGWKHYEIRNHPENIAANAIAFFPVTTIPQYQGESLNKDVKDKHLLILPEQGVGDEIMFASVLSELAPIVQQHPNTQITLACDARLVELFNRSFDFLSAIPKDPDNRYSDLEANTNNNTDNNPNNKADYWLFIGSLPKFYRNDIKDFDKHQPYLKANQQLLNQWQDRLSQLPHKQNIGISWTGGKKAEHKAERSLTLEQMLPILTKASQNANLINLQYGDHTEEIQNFKQKTNITIHDWEDADPLKDLDNFASQIKALDLVISIDNSTVHFAGALGTKTYVMLPFNQDWRWAENRADSYWYPNIMTLFRQTQDGQWDEVIQDVTNALE